MYQLPVSISAKHNAHHENHSKTNAFMDIYISTFQMIKGPSNMEHCVSGISLIDGMRRQETGIQ